MRLRNGSVLRWADVVQSVDSAGLAQVLRRSVAAALDAGTRQDPLDVLVQMSVDADPARGGAAAKHRIAITQCLVIGDQVIHRVIQQGLTNGMALEGAGIVEQNQFRTFDEPILDLSGEFRSVDQHHVECIDPMIGLDLLDRGGARWQLHLSLDPWHGRPDARGADARGRASLGSSWPRMIN